MLDLRCSLLGKTKENRYFCKLKWARAQIGRNIEKQIYNELRKKNCKGVGNLY